MGNPLGDNAWSMRIQYKPLVRYIWLGAIVMALGGIIAASDRRYRVKVPAAAQDIVPGGAPAPGSA
jgi:cytochrome c-type biogenesis protein CcmF